MWDFSLGGVDASDKAFSTLKVYIPDLPDVEEALVNIPNQQGLIQIGKKFKARIIKVEGFLEGSSYANLLTKIEEFNLFVFSESDKQLIFDTQIDRYYLAQKIKNEELKREATTCDRFLKFKCNDPFGYAVTPNDNDENGITVDGHNWTETNNGQYPVYPVITITFNQNQTHIYLNNTSVQECRFDITRPFVTGDVLEVYGRDMSVRLNDVNSPIGVGDGGDGKGGFPLFRIGENIMEAGTDDASLDLDVNVTYRNIFL